MNHFQVNSTGTIGQAHGDPDGVGDNAYIPALKALEGFSHINVIWWFDRLDDQKSRYLLQTEQPYKGAPAVMGIFATRSPQRPNRKQASSGWPSSTRRKIRRCWTSSPTPPALTASNIPAFPRGAATGPAVQRNPRTLTGMRSFPDMPAL